MFRSLLTFLLLALALPLLASERLDNPDIVNSDGFLRGHPDIRWRQEGLRHYEDGDYANALKYFRRAARYSDKPAQGMVAQMLWRGEGIERDPALAYAWMDLASERHYRVMLVQRELYWAALDATQQQRAIELGEGLYAEYGDVAARPRLEKALRRERRGSVGSRTGSGAGAVTIVLQTPMGTTTVDGSQFYHPDYWEPERYRELQDRDWKGPPKGIVEIGPLQSGGAAIPPDAPQR